MRFRNSIRWRIQAWHGALLLAMCVGFGITAYELEMANALRGMDQELEMRLGALTTALSHGEESPGRPRPPDDREKPGNPSQGRPPKPPGLQSAAIQSLFSANETQSIYYQAWSRYGTIIDRSGAAPKGIPRPVSSPAISKSIRTRDDMREAYLFTPPGECLLVGSPLAGLQRNMREFSWKLTCIGTAVLGFGLAMGGWIAKRALRPISQISAAAIRIADGNLKERIGTTGTENELGELASLLDVTFQRLDAAFDAQARFTSDAAHELRTPVSIILAQSQLALAKDRSIRDYQESIEISQRAAKRMHALIESLLQLSVLDARAIERNLKPIDLQEIASEQILLIGSLAREKNITVTSDLQPAPCLANADHIAQVLINLLANSLKFCPSGSEVKVLSGAESESVFLTVSDNGPGIHDHHLPHLFERFYRVESSRNRATGGAGLGLSICKRIAEAHGGGISVTSRENQGCTFKLSIPRAES